MVRFRFAHRLAAALAAAPLAAAAQGNAPDLLTDASELKALLAQPVYDSGQAEGASKRAQDIDSVPSTVYVRTGGEIRAQGYRTLSEVLESMPGVHRRYDRLYSYAGVRGISQLGDSSSRILVLINGTRVNDALCDASSIDHQFPLDMALVERVEYLPGPGSSLYGSNALLAMVNVITVKASALSGAQASAELSAWGGRKAGLTWGGELLGARVVLGLSRERRRGQDHYEPAYDTPALNNGWAVGRDDEDSERLFLRAQREGLAWTSLWSQRVKGSSTGALGSTYNQPFPWTDAYLSHELSYTASPRPHAGLYATLGYAQYRFDSAGFFRGDASLFNTTHSETGWGYGEVRYSDQLSESHRVTFGFEFMRIVHQRMTDHDVTATSDTRVAVDGQAWRHGVYVSDDWTIVPSLVATAGLRLDRGETGNHRLTPRAALVWTASPTLTLKWLGGRSLREPTFSERDFEDAGQRKPVGLRPETAASHELVVLWQPSSRWRWTASAYEQKLRDTIELAPADDALMFQNRPGARSRGLEVEGGYTSARGIHLRGSVTAQRADDIATGAQITNAPRRLAKAAMTVPLSVPGLGLGLNALYVGAGRITLDGRSLPSYTRINATLNHAPPDSPWSLSASVYNLTDRRYDDPAGPEHRQDVIRQNGREWRLQASRSF